MLFPKTIRGRVLYTSSSSYYGFQFALVSRISSFTPSSGGPLYVTVSPRRHPPLRYNYIHSGAAERQCLSSYLKMGGGVSFTFHIHIRLMLSPFMILLLFIIISQRPRPTSHYHFVRLFLCIVRAFKTHRIRTPASQAQR